MVHPSSKAFCKRNSARNPIRPRRLSKSAVKTLAEQALSNTALISDDALRSIESIVAEIDKKLTEQVNLILHHEDFQKLEGAWRGLHYLVNNTETDEMLKIRVMNISKKDLHKTLKKFKGTAWDQSPIFKKLYEGGIRPVRWRTLWLPGRRLSLRPQPAGRRTARRDGQDRRGRPRPFIAGAKPTLMQMDSWQELSNPRDLTKIFQTPEYAAWRSLRESEDAQYIGLAMPRFLSRLPYGAKTEPGRGVRLRGRHRGADHNKYAWANAAYAMAVNINRSFKEYGWCCRIRGVESGGAVEDLPSHTFPTDDGGVDMKCPTEIAISDRREAELAKNGFMPLIHRKNYDFAAFIGAQSLHKPAEYDDPDATANANLAARLPYLFATCRFAHYLKCIVRDKIGSFKSRRTWSPGCKTGSTITLISMPTFRRKMRRRGSRWRRPKSLSKRSKAIPATTLRSSSCDRITSWKVFRYHCGLFPSSLLKKVPDPSN